MNERDIALLRDLARFNGLDSNTIQTIHFKNSTYYGQRMSAYIKSGYVNKVQLYEKNANNAIKKGAIYYITKKGLDAIKSDIAPNRVVPDLNDFNKQLFLGALYTRLPNLLSPRETRKKFGVENYLPIGCSLPTSPPTIVHIVGQEKTQAALVKFINKRLFPADHIIVDTEFLPRYATCEARFVHWDNALDVIVNYVNDKEHYLNEMASVLKAHIPDMQVIKSRPFWTGVLPNGKFYFTELATGSIDIMNRLKNPPPEMFVLLFKRQDAHIIPTDIGKELYIYEKSTNKFFTATRKENKRFRFEEFAIN